MASTESNSASVLRPGHPERTLGESELHELVEIHLRRIDQRYTSGRQAVVTLLATFGRPMSISDISDALPDVPRSSAYRHLSDLQLAGSFGASPRTTSSLDSSSPRISRITTTTSSARSAAK